MADERLGQAAPRRAATNQVTDERGDRREDAERGGRASMERAITENRQLTEAERLEMYAGGLYGEILPSLPPIEGFKTVWATTTNSKDSIERRLLLGYDFVKPEDVPGLPKIPTLKGGDYNGVVGMREMIAMKLPIGLWHKYMTIDHHDKPARLVEGIMSQINETGAKLRDEGSQLLMGEGHRKMEADAKRKPRFDTETVAER